MKKRLLLVSILFGIMLLLVSCNSVETSYRVTFYNGSEIISEAHYKKGEEIVFPDTPTKEGAYFLGWDYNNDGEVDEFTTCHNNMNIRAVFGDTKTYTVIFKDGEVELSKRVYSEGAVPTAPTSPTKEGYIFVGWDLNNDDEIDDIKAVTADVTYTAVFRDDNQTYLVEFYVNGSVVSSSEYHLNETVNNPDLTPTKERTAQYTYTFKGWDVNGDGDVETFPFTVKGNHKFIALFDETVNTYTYKLYDGLTLLYTKTVEYGTRIVYEGQNYKKDAFGKYHIIIGWDKTGNGKPDDDVIVADESYQAVYTDKQIVIMHFEEEEHVLYAPKGVMFELYEPALPSSRRCIWYLDNTYETPYDPKPMIEGNLELYGRSEVSYTIDCSVLDASLVSTVNSEEELLLLFDYMVLTRTSTHTVKINYTNSDEEFATLLCDNCNIDCSYQISTLYNPYSKELKVTLQYRVVNTDSTKHLYEENGIGYYAQYDSLNYKPNETPRSDGFKLFIDDVENTFEVDNSEQLYYVLEHGYRPIIKSGNTNLQNLYDKMRNVLKEIINDEMTDAEKALAIYEWLVMNVTYDRVALELSSNPNVVTFHSFYLEGVFDDHLAVCDGISKAYACLCNMEGIPAVRVTGTGKQNHAWNKICIHNNWYVVDATSGGTIINNSYEVLTHRFFMITDEDYSSVYTEDGKYYSYIKALGEYDYYDKYTYHYDYRDSKFKCESRNDLVRVLRWFKSVDATNTTIDIELAFEYTGETSVLVSSAMTEAHYSSSVNYSVDGNIVMFLK